jgi:hypothetical protein
MDEQSNNTETFTVSIPHTVTLPLAPIVEAVKAALPQQAETLTQDDIEKVLDEKFDDCLSEAFDIHNYYDEVRSIVEDYLLEGSVDDAVSSVIDSNYTILDKDDVGDIVTSVIDEDYSFLSEDEVNRLISYALANWELTYEARLLARIERLEYLLHKIGDAFASIATEEGSAV